MEDLWWCQVEVSNKTVCLESELTLGDGLQGECSMACFLQGVPSLQPFLL